MAIVINALRNSETCRQFIDKKFHKYFTVNLFCYTVIVVLVGYNDEHLQYLSISCVSVIERLLECFSYKGE